LLRSKLRTSPFPLDSGKIILQFAQPSAAYLDLINEIDVFPTYFGELAMVKGDVSPTLVGQIGPRDRWSPPE
jgi:hypothetical protein